MTTLVRTVDIINALGYPNTSASDAIIEQAERTANDCNALAKPQAAYCTVKIESIKGSCVTLETGDKFCDPLVAKGLANCSHVILAIITVGNALDSAINDAFNSDDFLAGMMLDAAGSAAVGAHSRHIWRNFIEELKEGQGITAGFSPGEKGWNIKAQKVFFKLVDTLEIDVTLSDTCVMTPAKSISILYGIGDGIPISKESHNCLHCTEKNCPNRDTREIIVTVHQGNETHQLSTTLGTPLIDLLRENQLYVDAPCGGRGTCGACKSKFIKLLPEPNSSDEAALTDEELAAGYRLVCQVTVEHPLELELNKKESMVVLTDDNSNASTIVNTSNTYGVAIDIGTTTIAAFLVDMESGKVVDRTSGMNSQRQYGADVASRILYSMSEKNGKQELQDCITQQLEEMIHALMNRNNLSTIAHVMVAGNTVVAHILLGYDTDSLGVAPYTPVSTKRATVPCKSLNINVDCNLTMMEGIAAYVGSDITVGATEVGLLENDEFCLLIDLGTNGEMMLSNKTHSYCCSTAAGPAFEAANIHSGLGGVPGAISSVKMKQVMQNRYELDTTVIGDVTPRGICGSGVLDITSELKKHNIVDPSGRMQEVPSLVKEDDELGRYINLADNVVFTQQDVREIQLAKAAIAGGIRVLLEYANISYKDVKTTYIAGGFGNYINIDSALSIGLLPPELADTIVSAGNTAGKGAIKALVDESFCEKVNGCATHTEYIELSTNLSFQMYYIEEMGL